MNTNALTIIDAAEKKLVNTVLLDDVDLGAANPWGVATTADGKTICVAHAGTHELSVIDAPGVMDEAGEDPGRRPKRPTSRPYDDRGIYASTTPGRRAQRPGVPRRPAAARAARRATARGAWPSSSPTAYVAEYFSDTLGVVDLDAEAGQAGQAVRQIALGPKPELTSQRRGEMLFNDATICFQHWQSCASCHPDARVDALNWDLMNDGLGNPKNNKSMLLVASDAAVDVRRACATTAEEAVRSGITHIQFAVRPEEDAVAIDEYLKSLKPVPSPHLVDGKLSPAAERGKKVFFDEDGRLRQLPSRAALHRPEDARRRIAAASTTAATTFDTPTLVECWRTAPYMHDGHYTTMKELFTKGKHGGKRGDVDKLTAAADRRPGRVRAVAVGHQ